LVAEKIFGSESAKRQKDLFLESERINCLGLSYCIPEIKSKYFLVANIKYMLKIKFKENI
jgi:hypothetical protein